MLIKEQKETKALSAKRILKTPKAWQKRLRYSSVHAIDRWKQMPPAKSWGSTKSKTGKKIFFRWQIA